MRESFNNSKNYWLYFLIVYLAVYLAVIFLDWYFKGLINFYLNVTFFHLYLCFLIFLVLYFYRENLQNKIVKSPYWPKINSLAKTILGNITKISQVIVKSNLLTYLFLLSLFILVSPEKSIDFLTKTDRFQKIGQLLNQIRGYCLLIATVILCRIAFDLNKKKIDKLVNKKEVLKHLFFIFLIFTTLIYLLTAYFPDNKWVNKIDQIFGLFKGFLTAITIILGVVVFYLNREKINADLKKEKSNELSAEEKRKGEFSEKFPKINKIPILGNFLKFIYKEGWQYSLGLILIVLVGFGLRIYRLDFLSPTGDEYRHLLAMKRFFADGTFGYQFDQLVNYILVFFKYIFNSSSLFILRLPFALAGTFSIILFYLVTKEGIKNKKIAIIASYLFASCPLAIGLARYVRGYELILFLSLLLIYLNQRCAKKSFKTTVIGAFILLAIFKIFESFNLTHAIAKAAFYCFGIFIGIFLLSEIMNKRLKKRNWVNIAARLILFIFIFIIGVYLMPWVSNYERPSEIESRYLYFINYYPSDALWYFKIIPYTLPLLFLIIPFFLKTGNSYIYSLFFTVSFVTYFHLSYFDAAKRFQERYIYYLLPYFILLASIGIYYLYSIYKNIVGKFRYKTILFILIFFIIFSPIKAFNYTIHETNGEINKKNQLAYFDAKELVEFLNTIPIQDKRILTTQPWIFDYYYNFSFLETEEKERYVYFPKEWNYEFINRTKIWSINGYWSEENIKTINILIKKENIEYLIFHALPKNPDYKYSYSSVLKNINNTKLIKIIDSDKTFGFYIYKVVNDETKN